jgi:putative peptidoglycan lipid II flippase
MISLVAFYGGVLNSIGKYFPFAAAPVILNIVLIIFAYMPSNEEQGLRWLAVGIVVAGVLELIWMLYFLYKAGYLLRLKKLKITQEVKLLSKRMVPGIIGSGVAQINIFVDTIIASFIPGALSYLYYADRVHQLPLALIGTTLGVVMLPMLARSFKKGEIKEGIKLHNQVLDFLLFVSIPSAFALGVMAYEIVEVLFERGAFSHKASIESAKALIAFSIGLPAYSVAKTFISNFHANGDTKTPVKVAAVCIVLNVIISLSLLSYLGHIGIALASSCSIWVNMSTLWIISSKRGWFKLYEPIKIKFLKYTISASIMAVLILLIKISLKESSVYSLLSIMILLGGNSYLMIVFGMKAMTVKELKGYLKKNK